MSTPENQFLGQREAEVLEKRALLDQHRAPHSTPAAAPVTGAGDLRTALLDALWQEAEAAKAFAVTRGHRVAVMRVVSRALQNHHASNVSNERLDEAIARVLGTSGVGLRFATALRTAVTGGFVDALEGDNPIGPGAVPETPESLLATWATRAAAVGLSTE